MVNGVTISQLHRNNTAVLIRHKRSKKSYATADNGSNEKTAIGNRQRKYDRRRSVGGSIGTVLSIVFSMRKIQFKDDFFIEMSCPPHYKLIALRQNGD